MSKIKNGGLDQYGPEPFEQQQFGTAGVEGVKQLATKELKTETDERKKSETGQKVHERQFGRYQLSVVGRNCGKI